MICSHGTQRIARRVIENVSVMTDRLAMMVATVALDGHRCWQNGGTIFLSAVTDWEIALLVDTGRIDLDIPVEGWIERFLDRPGIDGVPLDYRAASRSYQLHHLEHRDPADRLLIATAIELACPLVTYDERIAGFGKRRGRQFRFAVGA